MVFPISITFLLQLKGGLLFVWEVNDINHLVCKERVLYKLMEMNPQGNCMCFSHNTITAFDTTVKTVSIYQFVNGNRSGRFREDLYITLDCQINRGGGKEAFSLVN